MVKKLGNATETVEMGANITSIGADVSSASKTMGGTNNLAVDAGFGGLSLADSIKNSQQQEKEAKKLQKNIEKTAMERNKILKQLNSPDAKNSMKMKNLQGTLDDKILNRWSVSNDKDVQKLASLQVSKEKKYKNLQSLR